MPEPNENISDPNAVYLSMKNTPEILLSSAALSGKARVGCRHALHAAKPVKLLDLFHPKLL